MAARRNGWCLACCTRHAGDARCPGNLLASGEERFGWKVRVKTQRGLEAYGILVAEAGDLWRARVLTFPRTLWMVPGGGGSLKFAAGSPREAEREAIRFVREHCESNGYEILSTETVSHPDWIDMEAGAVGRDDSPEPRKVRFLPVRYGVAGPTERGRTGNLSTTGLFVITDAPVDSGKVLDMLLEVDDEKVPLRGEVRWANRGHVMGRSPGMGIRLQSPPGRYVEYVNSLT